MLTEEAHAKLVKMLRMLSSGVDGEALAAVRGIERVLAGAGLSFHELAEAFAKQVVEVVRVRVVERERVVEVERDSTGDWLDACNQLLEGGVGFADGWAGLNPRELEFVEDMRRRFVLRPGWQPSDKQVSWFVAIYRRSGLRPRANVQGGAGLCGG